MGGGDAVGLHAGIGSLVVMTTGGEDSGPGNETVMAAAATERAKREGFFIWLPCKR